MIESDKTGTERLDWGIACHCMLIMFYHFLLIILIIQSGLIVAYECQSTKMANMVTDVFPWHLLTEIWKHDICRCLTDGRNFTWCWNASIGTHCLLPNMHLRNVEGMLCYHGCGVHCKTIPSCGVKLLWFGCRFEQSGTGKHPWQGTRGSWVSLKENHSGSFIHIPKASWILLLFWKGRKGGWGCESSALIQHH